MTDTGQLSFSVNGAFSAPHKPHAFNQSYLQNGTLKLTTKYLYTKYLYTKYLYTKYLYLYTKYLYTKYLKGAFSAPHL